MRVRSLKTVSVNSHVTDPSAKEGIIMKTRKRFFATSMIAIVLLWLVITPTTQAGSKYQYPVYVNTYSFSGESYTIAAGNVADTRNSTDVTSYIACSLYYNQGSQNSGMCQAYSASGQYAYCSTTDPAALQVIGTMKGDSYVQFEYYANNSTCTFVSTTNASYLAPK